MRIKNALMTTLWFFMSLLPVLFMPVAYIFYWTGVTMVQAINKSMDHCIANLGKYEDAE